MSRGALLSRRLLRGDGVPRGFSQPADGVFGSFGVRALWRRTLSGGFGSPVESRVPPRKLSSTDVP